MLRGNGTYLNLNAGRLRGGGAAPISQGNYQKVGAWRGVALQDMETAAKPLIGYPTGYSGEGWFMPITGGELTSLYNTDFSLSGSGAGVLGLPGDGTSTFGFLTEATGGLVSTVAAGDAPATFGISTNAPLLTASISGTGSSSFGMSLNAPILGALGGMTVEATFGMTGTLTSHAIGIMEGTTADSGVTIDNIVTALETAVLPVNIVKVNDYDVTGNGQSGTEWGPA